MRLDGPGLGVKARHIEIAVAAAASASLGDTQYVAALRELTARERKKWFQLFERLKLRYARSRGAFVFFETGRPHAEFAAAMLKKRVDVGRVFPPADRWTRLSFGTPEENAVAREAVESVLKDLSGTLVG